MPTNPVYSEDKYAIRYLNLYEFRCEAFRFYRATCTYSDRVAFWYKDYASNDDAIKAAKAWLLRGELEKCPAEDEFLAWNLAEGMYGQPEPTIIKRRW